MTYEGMKATTYTGHTGNLSDVKYVDARSDNGFIREAIDILPLFNLNFIERLTHIIRNYSNTGFIYTCGNGGSATTASHFTADLMQKNMDSMCLSDNTSLITAIANDIDYDEIFALQLKSFASDWDLLVAISCSGNSRNIIEAVKVAKEIGMAVILFTSNGGGILVEDFVPNDSGMDTLVNVPTDNIYLAEGIHSLLLHNIINEL